MLKFKINGIQFTKGKKFEVDSKLYKLLEMSVPLDFPTRNVIFRDLEEDTISDELAIEYYLHLKDIGIQVSDLVTDAKPISNLDFDEDKTY